MSAWPEVWTVEIGTTPGLIPSGWDDVTDRLLEDDITPKYGRDDELSETDTGTASFRLDNFGGWKEFGIDPNTAVRITATLDSVTYPVLYHLIEAAPVVWPGAGTDSLIDVSTVDGMTLLAREDRDGVTRPRERTGARIAALLDLAGWPAGMRSIDDGVVLVDAIDDVAINLLNGIDEAVEAEQGQIYIAPDGVFTFHDRWSRLDAPVVAGLGDYDILLDHLGEPLLDHLGHEIGLYVDPAIRFSNLVPRYDDTTLWTVGRAEMADGAVFEYVDDSAVDLYGRRVYRVRDLPIAPAESETIVAWIVGRYANPSRRFEQLVVESDDAASLQILMTLRPGDLIRLQGPVPGSHVDELVHVEGIDHEIRTDLWRGTFRLSPYFGGADWLVFDDPELGAWDQERVFAP